MLKVERINEKQLQVGIKGKPTDLIDEWCELTKSLLEDNVCIKRMLLFHTLEVLADYKEEA